MLDGWGNWKEVDKKKKTKKGKIHLLFWAA